MDATKPQRDCLQPTACSLQPAASAVGLPTASSLRSTACVFAGRLLFTMGEGSFDPRLTKLTRMYSDRLGSTRATTVLTYGGGSTTRNYYPFGEEIGSTANNEYKFASTYRDSATGLDYAINRYYASGTARFLTPDPYQGSRVRGNPQTWNRYSYTLNDPVNASDPAGLDQTCYYNLPGHLGVPVCESTGEDAVDVEKALFGSDSTLLCYLDENSVEHFALEFAISSTSPSGGVTQYTRQAYNLDDASGMRVSAGDTSAYQVQNGFISVLSETNATGTQTYSSWWTTTQWAGVGILGSYHYGGLPYAYFGSTTLSYSWATYTSEGIWNHTSGRSGSFFYGVRMEMLSNGGFAISESYAGTEGSTSIRMEFDQGGLRYYDRDGRRYQRCSQKPGT